MLRNVTRITPTAITAAAEIAMMAEILNTISLFTCVSEAVLGFNTMGFGAPGGHATPTKVPHSPAFPETSLVFANAAVVGIGPVR